MANAREFTDEEVTSEGKLTSDSVSNEEQSSASTKKSSDAEPEPSVLKQENSQPGQESAVTSNEVTQDPIALPSEPASEPTQQEPADQDERTESQENNSVTPLLEIASEAAPPAKEETAVEEEAIENTSAGPDQGEEQQKETQEEEPKDFTKFTKDEYLNLMEELNKEENILKVDKTLRAIRPLFDELKNDERRRALDNHIAGGGSEDDFEFAWDQKTQQFEASYRLLKDKKRKYFKSLEKQKEENLVKANELLEQLRAFVDQDESSVSFKKFKEIQEAWKSLGPFPSNQSKNLWANYHALVNLYYDHRSIYFELKELDRKKNLEAKIELCERAEKLAAEENIKAAVIELNELHREFKHIGPVPKEEQEELWNRFKAASDSVYARRKEYFNSLKQVQQENLEKKREVIREIEELKDFNSDRIKDWNQKTKQLLALQKKWEAIGPVSKDQSKVINKQFWANFKGFFRKKGNFFKSLEKEREENQRLKEELITKAIELKDSTDWEKTANELKQLQREWKSIGPVPEKVRKETFDRFKSACDEFFNNLRANQDEAEKEYVKNLKEKEKVCKEIEQLAAKNPGNIEQLEVLKSRFNEIGHVPRNAINEIREAYKNAVGKFVNNSDELGEEDKTRLELEMQLGDLKNHPQADRKIHQKEQEIVKEIGKIENDINLWKNNMMFFRDSKNAQQVIDEFTQKVADAEKELKKLKKQKKLLRKL